MDTLKIKALLLAVKYKSLSKASAAFSYTPSALSHSVDSLEKKLGLQLLKRSHTGVTLSEAGELLLEKLSAVVEAEEELLRSARALSASKHNRLRIGTYASVASNLLPELLSGFMEKHPHTDVSIVVGNRLVGWLDQNTADVLIGIDYKDHPFFPLLKDEFVAVVPEGLFPEKGSVRMEELYPFPYIITDNIADVARDFDVNRFKELIRVTSEDDSAAVSMVREGMGVTVLPKLVLRKQQKGIRAIKLHPVQHRTLGVSYKKDFHTSSAVMQFVRYLQAMEY